jgi:hypothetical protein
MWITMMDIFSHNSLPETIDKPCWHCKDTFPFSPIGAPLKYHKQIVKENEICRCVDVFETEGIFCSFPCVKAWCITQSKNDIRYRDSGMLLALLYRKIYGEIIAIEPAGDWKLIDRWGGHLTIEEFRNTFCKLAYTVTPNLKRPTMLCVGTYIEELQSQSV